jgi:hypothetical protein
MGIPFNTCFFGMAILINPTRVFPGSPGMYCAVKVLTHLDGRPQWTAPGGANRAMITAPGHSTSMP